MNVRSYLEFQPTEHVLRARTSVCMHLLGPGKSNYRVMNDAMALVKAGYRVTIVDVISDQGQPDCEDVAGIQFLHIAAPSWFVPTRLKVWFVLKMFLLIVRCTRRLLYVKADIYHAHVEHTFLATYMVARLYRKKLIFDTPELTMFGPTIMRWPRLRNCAIQCIRRLTRNCDGYITGSPLYGPVLADLYHLEDILILRHIPPYRAVAKNMRLHKYLGLDASVRIVLYQGYMQEDRGLELLIYAANHLTPGIILILMGNSYGDTASKLMKLIDNEQVADRIKIVPAMPYNELLDWTSSADLGLILLPPDYSLSIRYCLPNKFFEYMMAGVPILASRLDAIASLIEQYQIGHILDELTPFHVAQTMMTMLRDQEMLDRMRINALNAISQGLYWEEESKRLIGLYHDLTLK
ncbi:glycosyl transferase [Dictyobacter alpinus]|uniref:Glycosyl transferase n=1 Tax=Dictyobacter alpinus TaxID=2014873 RepID=A0A402AZU0_9CHLR|nr:glycosyltransferase [Dictyobacter alpinus]GCE24577.1 glycosyl transferase [Dictyobacter alpinus]